MRLHLTASFLGALLLLPAASADGQARRRTSSSSGALQSVAAQTDARSLTARVVLDGRNPCQAILIDYGNGDVEALTIGALPATFLYDYGASGTYRITARGTGLCSGTVATTVRVGDGNAAGSPVTGSTGSMRFSGLDRNRDGVITRNEWRGNARSFDIHDWNGDGVLSGAEVRTDDTSGLSDDPVSRETRFEALDNNRDGLLTRGEWDASLAAFRWVDADGDGLVTRAEFRGDAVDVDDDVIDTPGARQVIVIDPRGPWTATPLVLAPGDIVTFEASGTVYLNEARTDVADPSGARDGRTAAASPLPRQPAGALIARIGNGPAFLVGGSTRGFRATTAGTLYLGVNDDFLDDNSGQFYVTVTRR